MKNILIWFLLISIMLFSGCQTQIDPNDPVSNAEQQPTETERENVAVNIPIDFVEGITSDEALKLCQEIVGVEDDESFMFQLAEVHTKRDVGYQIDGAAEFDGIEYYIVRMLWSGNEENNWSTIGHLGVSAGGNEIYEVTCHSDDTYTFNDLLWSN